MNPTLDQISTWARAAGSILRSGLGSQFQIDRKGEIDLVTEMDRRSEDYLIGQVRAHFPEHAIVSEEAGSLPPSSGVSLPGNLGACWYIDPLDGTMNYAHGVPIFAVSIGYAVDDRILLGVVYDPMQDELFSAERGRGAWLNGLPIHVSAQSTLDQAFLGTDFPYDLRQTAFNNIELFGRLLRRAQSVRRMGSAALGLAYLAAGRFDGYWEIRLKPWDLAAGALIVEEAGGVVTAFDGDANYLKPPYGILASNRVLHPVLFTSLQ
jgi:myo-inositol-1(or 4)-monophosphatase